MQKHPKMPLVASAPVCPFTINILMQPIQLSPYAFNRYLRKRARIASTPSHKTYGLPCGCYVWVYASGKRELSSLPF